MLPLLSLLQRRPFWTGVELAERLEVSQRTLRRDVERLRDLGYPVCASRGVGGGYGLGAGATVPPLLPDEDEAVAIVVGLQAVAASAITGIEETALRALTKITGLLPPRARLHAEALAAQTSSQSSSRRPAVAPRLLVSLAIASRDNRRVRFAYRTRSGEQAQRLVDPHRLVHIAGRWYLLAWDLDRGDWRTFRLDRIAEATQTGASFRPVRCPTRTRPPMCRPPSLPRRPPTTSTCSSRPRRRSWRKG